MTPPLRLLVVEDRPEDVELIALAIRRGGLLAETFRVETEAGLRAALDASRWDGVLSDFSMPSFDGLSAFRVVREKDPFLPFLLVSGTIGEEAAVAAMRAGVQDYLLKGHLTRLVPAVQREVAEAEVRRAHAAATTAARVLAAASSLREAAPAMLAALASQLRWDVVELWIEEEAERPLKQVAAWRAPGSAPGWGEALASASRASSAPSFVSGAVGGEPALAVPITRGAVRAGVLVAFARELRAPSPAYLQALADVGGQIGQFLGRRRTEGTLAAERRLLHALVDALGEGIVACDAEGGLTVVNRAARAMYGLTEDELPPGPLAGESPERDWDGGRTLDPSERPIARAFRGEAFDDLEVAIGRPDGKRRWVLANGRPITGAGGRRLGAVVALFDVSERRSLEAQFRQAQKMEALGRLAGGIAHDFNNLLTAILGFCGLLLERVHEDAPMAADLEEIRKAGERAAALTRQLLTFSRRDVVERRPVDLDAVVRDAQRMLRRLIGEDVQLVVTLDAPRERVRADPGQVEQVLMNLVVNARDAMPKGGRIHIATAAAFLDEEHVRRHLGASAGAHVKLTVEDGGTGIPAELLPRIFEPFFTTKEPGKGTGLGLATVYGIVRQGGGHVVVESVPGQGTRFDVYFPTEAAEGGAALSPGTQAPARSGVRILLCEDDQGVALLATRVLSERGYRVLATTRAEEAVAAVDEGFAPQLLLTDNVLPGVHGPELAAALRSRLPGLKVVLVSGYADRLTVAERSRADLFLQKPFSPADLLNAVAATLDEDREERPAS